MISRGGKGLRQVFEDGLARVTDGGGLPVHQPSGPHHFPAKDMADALVPQAHAQDRCALPKSANDITTDTRLLRRARAGGDTNVVRLHPGNIIQRDLVIAMNLHLRPHLAKILDEVVGEGVVVIYDQKHGCSDHPRPAQKCKLRPRSDHTVFTEAKVRLPPVLPWQADDDMVHKIQPQDLRPLLESPGQRLVRRAWSWVP
jgi:hypothetical protein